MLLLTIFIVRFWCSVVISAFLFLFRVVKQPYRKPKTSFVKTKVISHFVCKNHQFKQRTNEAKTIEINVTGPSGYVQLVIGSGIDQSELAKLASHIINYIITLQYITIQYSTVHNNIVEYSTIEFSTYNLLNGFPFYMGIYFYESERRAKYNLTSKNKYRKQLEKVTRAV